MCSIQHNIFLLRGTMCLMGVNMSTKWWIVLTIQHIWSIPHSRSQQLWDNSIMVLAGANLWESANQQNLQKKIMFFTIWFQPQRSMQYWKIPYSWWGMQVQILQGFLQPFSWKILPGDDLNVAKYILLLKKVAALRLPEQAFKVLKL